MSLITIKHLLSRLQIKAIDCLIEVVLNVYALSPPVGIWTTSHAEEYNVCSDDTAFQCSSNQKPITIICKSFGTFCNWLDTMIANQLLLLLALSMLWPSTAMPLKPGNIGRVFGMPDADGGRVLQRSKRGWMWNQFFLLEEYTGNDHQYVGKVTCAWCTHTL